MIQGALKLILEPIFEADFQAGSFGYRPRRSPHDAIQRVSEVIIEGKTHIIDLDLRSYFDTVRHHIVLEKVARRVNDDDVMHLLKMILKASGKQGVPQGGVITPRTQKVTLVVCATFGLARSRRAIIGRERRHSRDAVSDDDIVVADENVLDHKAHDGADAR